MPDEFLAEVRGLPHRNLAVDLLRRLLNDEIKTRSRRHLVQSRSFAEMLERSIRGYHQRAVETARIIEQMKESSRAKLRVLVKRVLRKYGYPPDKQEKATQTVLEQAELFGEDWAA